MSDVNVVTPPNGPTLHLQDVRYLIGTDEQAHCTTTRCGRRVTDAWIVEQAAVPEPSPAEVDGQWCKPCRRAKAGAA